MSGPRLSVTGVHTEGAAAAGDKETTAVSSIVHPVGREQRCSLEPRCLQPMVRGPVPVCRFLIWYRAAVGHGDKNLYQFH